MKPVRLWIGLVLLTLGVLGILDATGALESTEVIDRWWGGTHLTNDKLWRWDPVLLVP